VVLLSSNSTHPDTYANSYAYTYAIP